MRIRTLALVALAGCSAPPYRGEEVNIAYTPAVDVAEYRTWSLDEGACVDFADVRLDSADIRRTIVETVTEELAGYGLERLEAGEVDLLVHYRLDVREADDLPGVSERTVGRLFLRDVATGRVIWRGERRTPFTEIRRGEELEAAVRDYVVEVLGYLEHLEHLGGAAVERTR